MDNELKAPRRTGTAGLSAWATAALAAVAVSAFGYITQLVLDFATDGPTIAGAVFFFGVFGGAAFAALLLGIAALIAGRHWRGDRHRGTTKAGVLAVCYVIVMQTIQSLWD